MMFGPKFMATYIVFSEYYVVFTVNLGERRFSTITCF